MVRVTKYIAGILIITILFSCRGLVPISPQGDYAFFWQKCKSIEGIAVINGKLYPYTTKVPYARTSNRFFGKNILYLGNGYDYHQDMVTKLESIVNTCEQLEPPELKIDVSSIAK